jgi:acetyltransferase-like isoleucine patch superfamily enzyme
MIVVKAIVAILPWCIKKFLLTRFFGYRLEQGTYIGISWFYPKRLTMRRNSKVGHFNVAIHLDEIDIGEMSSIGRANWITGFGTSKGSSHFSHQPDRKSKLTVGKHSAITKQHHLDCTSEINIGEYATIAGYNSQFLTHSIDLDSCIQSSRSIYIGKYTFISTNVTVLGGARLPDYCVLGAKSLLNKSLDKEWALYGGVPAQFIKPISQSAKYFARTIGYVS